MLMAVVAMLAAYLLLLRNTIACCVHCLILTTGQGLMPFAMVFIKPQIAEQLVGMCREWTGRGNVIFFMKFAFLEIAKS